MNRFATLLYGSVCYAIFFGTFLYAVGFLGNSRRTQVHRLGRRRPAGSGRPAINAGCSTLFALQHSVMARPASSAGGPASSRGPVERSTYVLASSIAVIVLFWAWQPMPAVVFQVETPRRREPRSARSSWAGSGLVLYSTFLIDHFDLFGLRQVVPPLPGTTVSRRRSSSRLRCTSTCGIRSTSAGSSSFWATPDMTVGHLLMAVGTTAYILVAIVFEERDLSTRPRRGLPALPRAHADVPAPPLSSRRSGIDIRRPRSAA